MVTLRSIILLYVYTKNDTPSVSAPEFIAIPKGGHNLPKGGISRRGDLLGAGMARVDYNRALREIQNYRNGRKTRENIPFEIKKMIDSKGMDSEGMEGKPRKIFGSNGKC